LCITFGSLIGAPISCDSSQGSNTFNPACTSSGEPYCVQTVAEPSQYQCAECIGNCDCGVNSYCSSAPGTIGQCKTFSKAGSSCRALSNNQLTDVDYNQDWKCAELYSQDSNLQIDQAGVCINGKCRYCDYVNGNGGLRTCGVSDGKGVARSCVYPGELVHTHWQNWHDGLYFQTPENVWWAIFFVFFFILILVQIAILVITIKRR